MIKRLDEAGFIVWPWSVSGPKDGRDAIWAGVRFFLTHLSMLLGRDGALFSSALTAPFLCTSRGGHGKPEGSEPLAQSLAGCCAWIKRDYARDSMFEDRHG